MSLKVDMSKKVSKRVSLNDIPVVFPSLPILLDLTYKLRVEVQDFCLVHGLDDSIEDLGITDLVKLAVKITKNPCRVASSGG